MFNDKPKNKFNPAQLWRYGLFLIVIWSLFISVSLLWKFRAGKSGTLKAARIEARTAFEKDVLYRRWNASHGGLYAPVTGVTQPNLYLEVPERDIQTPSGIKLTKINPAFMTRQVHEIVMKTHGVQGHLTSLNPIRPQNAPDKWETNALKAFERGVEEVSSVEILNGNIYMRLMRPLVTEKSCLKCHAKHGYNLGEIRGGISAAVPLTQLMAIERSSFITFSIIDGLLWFVGIAGIMLSMFFLHRQIIFRLQVEDDLRKGEKLKGVIEMAGAVCHELNQPLHTISGNSELLMMNVKEDDPHYSKIKTIKEQIDRMGKITRKLMGITRYETTRYPESRIINIDKASSFK